MGSAVDISVITGTTIAAVVVVVIIGVVVIAEVEEVGAGGELGTYGR